MDSNNLVAISEMVDYKLYAFSLWERNRYMRNLDMDLANFLEVNIISYIMAYRDIQECK